MKRFAGKVRQQYLQQGLLPCSVCKQILPISNFSKNSRSSVGFASQCNRCLHNYGGHIKCQKYPTTVRQKYLEHGMFPCGHCGAIKKLDNFYKNKSTSSGYQQICKDCVKLLRQKKIL